MAAQKNRLETALLSTHNICFIQFHTLIWGKGGGGGGAASLTNLHCIHERIIAILQKLNTEFL